MSPKRAPHASVRPRSVSAEALALLAPDMLRAIGRPRKAPPAVLFLGNATMRRLKREWLGKDAAFVDVLAFPEAKRFPHPDSALPPQGDIYLNSAFRAMPRKCLFLFIHGLLHLAGFSHEAKRDTIAMEELEKKLLRRSRFVRGRPVFD